MDVHAFTIVNHHYIPNNFLMELSSPLLVQGLPAPSLEIC